MAKKKGTEMLGRREALAAKVMFFVLGQLAEYGGTLDLATLRKKVEQYMHLDAWDMTILPHGKSRWCSALERYSHGYVKAKLITKDRGRWSITADGWKALHGDALTMFGISRTAVLIARGRPTRLKRRRTVKTTYSDLI